MIRRLIAGTAVVLMVAGMIACAGSSSSQLTTPTAVSTATVSEPFVPPNASVDGLVGDWQADALTDPAAIAAADAAAARSCSQVEFHAVRDVDSKTAVVVFAATCARVRIRVEGKGTMSGDTLVWKAEGKVTLPNGNMCAARFAEGNKAQPAPEGQVKVTYNGAVCGNPVSGTTLVRRR